MIAKAEGPVDLLQPAVYSGNPGLPRERPADGPFRKKPLMQLIGECSARNTLQRVLSPWELLLLGIGSTVGAGIFVVTGVAAGNYAGPAVVLSFVIAGIAALFAAMCYVELAAMIPCAGSAYTYAYAGLGEIGAWIIGWDLILEYAFSISAVAVGWSGYVGTLFSNAGVPISAALSNPYGVSGGLVNLPAVFIILCVTALLITGVRGSALINNIIVIVKIGVILLFLFLATSHISAANYTPFAPYGWNGILTGAAIVFFAFIGFDAVTTAAEETENPRRNIPLGIIGSAVIVLILYVAVAGVLTGVVPYTSLINNNAPISYALTAIGIPWGAALVSVGAIAGLTSVLIVTLYGQTRIFYAMARDGLLPRVFATVHPRYHTPVTITLITGSVTALIAGFLPLDIIVQLVNVGTLSAFIIVALTVIVLRRTAPDAPRSFRTPLVPFVPLLCMLFCLGLISVLPVVTLLRFVIWFVAGLVVYYFYGFRHSNLGTAVMAAPEE
jgi:basic amino acid/polyamine antiporter, APA family